MACPPRRIAALPVGSYLCAGVQRMDISGAVVSSPNVDTHGPIRMESPSLKKRRGANGKKVKLPRLKIRKNTRATIGGLIIAAVSLWGLTTAYDEARDNILSFLFYTIVLLLLIALTAVCVVAVIYTVKKIVRRVFAKNSEEKQE